ncbi:MAG: ABC transporter ATP-binding protein [Halanaerobiales bacterium]
MKDFEKDIYSIQVKNLNKSYGNLQAVANISFQVKPGEIFGFLGPNGAGKTTTTRMLTGVFPPDSGEIYIAGNNLIENTLKAKMKMGVVPELANAYMDLTAKENILFTAEMYGLSGKKIEDKTEQLLEKFGMSDRKDDIIKNFSKGMKQRIVICMALINEPDILFLDEPTSGLDVQSTRLIRRVIRDLNQKGTTIFLTTHNINEANELCDRIAIMNNGEIAAIDSPENLKNTFQKSQSVEVSFEGQVQVSFKKISGVISIEKRGDKIRLYTKNPGQVIEELVATLKKNGNKIKTLNTLEPELEEVFVLLTGGDLNNEN